MNVRMTGALLGVGIALLVGAGVPAAQASTQHHRDSSLRPRLSVCFCGGGGEDGAVTALFRVDRYLPDRRAWVPASDVPVTVEARIPGNSSPDGWTPQVLLPHGGHSTDASTGEDGGGHVRLEPQVMTMEYRLLLVDGTHTVAVRPQCPQADGQGLHT